MRKILLADDDREWLHTLAEFLSERGFNFGFADNGYSAIAKVESNKYDFVISDYSMAAGDGVTLSHFCYDRGIPCVIATGFNTKSLDGYFPERTLVFSKTNCLTDSIFLDILDTFQHRSMSDLDFSRVINCLCVGVEAKEVQSISSMLSSVPFARYRVEGRESLDDLQTDMMGSRFDVFLMDLCSLGEHAFKTLEAARGRGEGAPAIFLIRDGENDVDLAGRLSGADDFLAHSFLSGNQLDRSIRYAIEKRRKHQLETAKQVQLSKALKLSSLGKMAATIAHEVKNPLAIIDGHANSLARAMGSKDSLDLEDCARRIGKVRSMCERITKIIGGVQNAARGVYDSEAAKVDVNEIVRESFELCASRRTSDNTDMIFESKEALLIEAVASELTQVVFNLVANAADAVEGLDKKWIRVETMDEGDLVKIVVTDSGFGIPPERQSEIFDSFYTTKEKGKGTGLGLGIVKGLCEKQGGSIKLDTKSPHTRFVVELPKEHSGRYRNSCDQNVLIVDDDNDFMATVELELNEAGYKNISRANDGAAALKIMKQESIDVVVTDVIMPGVSGVKLFQSVDEESDRQPAFVFITGFSPDYVPKDVLERSEGLLTKPFPSADLVAMISRANYTQRSVERESDLV